MKKIMRLVGIQLWAMLSDTFSLNRKRKSKALLPGVLLFALLIGFVAFVYCYGIGISLLMFDSIDILPVLVMSVSCFLLILTTINKVKGTIFGFKDYDMVMSLPVSTGSIVASRLLLLYGINLFFTAIIMIPAMLVYQLLAKPGIWFLIFGFIILLFIPLIPIIAASVLGTAIAYAASRFRHSNVINIIISFGLIIGIMGFSMSMGDSEEGLAQISRLLTDKVNNIYPLSSLYLKAVINYDVSALLLFIGISLASFIIYSFLIGKVFKKINTSIMSVKFKSKYKKQSVKEASPVKALFRKELKRYFSSSLYVLNTAFGIVLLTIGAIALFFIDIEQTMGGPMVIKLIGNVMPIGMGFCTMMCCTTMSSISLEGKSLWIIKSIPVTSKQIFLAKIGVNMVVVSPIIIDGIIFCYFFKTNLLQSIITILLPLICALFVAVFGLILNLSLPNLTWTSETIVIKQSLPTFIVTFSSMFILALPLIFLALPFDFAYALLGYFLLMVIVTIILYRVLITWGDKRFRQL